MLWECCSLVCLFLPVSRASLSCCEALTCCSLACLSSRLSCASLSCWEVLTRCNLACKVWELRFALFLSLASLCQPLASLFRSVRSMVGMISFISMLLFCYLCSENFSRTLSSWRAWRSTLVVRRIHNWKDNKEEILRWDENEKHMMKHWMEWHQERSMYALNLDKMTKYIWNIYIKNLTKILHQPPH